MWNIFHFNFPLKFSRNFQETTSEQIHPFATPLHKIQFSILHLYHLRSTIKRLRGHSKCIKHVHFDVNGKKHSCSERSSFERKIGRKYTKKTNQKDKVEVGQSACNYTDMSTERWQYRFFVQVAMTSVSFTICRKYNIFSKYTYREQVHWGTHPSK